MIMDDDPQSQPEKRRVVLQDADVKRQQKRETERSGTYFSHTRSDEGGRFAALGTPHKVGSTPAQQLPKLPNSSPWANDPVPDEAPTGIAIDDEHFRRLRP